VTVPCPSILIGWEVLTLYNVWLVEKISLMLCCDCAVCRDFSHSYEICSICTSM
jgi:hypothetical protein